MSQVLIVSAEGDWSAEQVADQLAFRGCDLVWLDPAKFPLHLGISARLDGSRWAGALGSAELDSVSAVYYRRPGDFVMPAGMSGPELRFGG